GCSDVCGAFAPGRGAGGGGVCCACGAGGVAGTRCGECGATHAGCLSAAGVDAFCGLDVAQLARVSRGPAAGSEVCNRSGRADVAGMAALDEDMVPGLRFD